MPVILLGLSILWAGTVAVLLIRAVSQYQKYEVLRPVKLPEDAAFPHVAIIIPARNEQASIDRALAGVASQDYPADRLRIYVVDDQSTDDTAAIVERWRERDARIELVRGDSLPPGWAGKPHACYCGVIEAERDSAAADWLCFIDADTAAQPALLSIAVHTAAERHLDLLSLEPTQELLTWSERLIFPAGFLLLAFVHDIAAVSDPKNPAATANGQFILVRRSVYDQLGGHSAPSVREAISEDAAIAKLFKRRGFRIALIGTAGLVSTRMYRNFAELWQGLGKNLTEMIGSSRGTMITAACAFAMAIAALGLPIAGVIAVSSHASAIAIAALVFALAGSGAMLGTHIGTALYLKIPWLYGLLFPIGYLLGGALALNAVMHRARRQVAWKGRILHIGAAPAEGVAAEPMVLPLREVGR